jgi:hypothetical protein
LNEVIVVHELVLPDTVDGVPLSPGVFVSYIPINKRTELTGGVKEAVVNDDT